MKSWAHMNRHKPQLKETETDTHLPTHRPQPTNARVIAIAESNIELEGGGGLVAGKNRGPSLSAASEVRPPKP